MSGKAAERKHGWGTEHTDALRAYMLQRGHSQPLPVGILKESKSLFRSIISNFLAGRIQCMKQKLEKGIKNI
jgi:hypothetical protein